MKILLSLRIYARTYPLILYQPVYANLNASRYSIENTEATTSSWGLQSLPTTCQIGGSPLIASMPLTASGNIRAFPLQWGASLEFDVTMKLFSSLNLFFAT